MDTGYLSRLRDPVTDVFWIAAIGGLSILVAAVAVLWFATLCVLALVFRGGLIVFFAAAGLADRLTIRKDEVLVPEEEKITDAGIKRT